ncbi:MAG: hypothetical protein HYZ11_10295 [Candidatus Tectomicrobia bacterium]|uniref:Uncharacterized protein n=1 Tax=Tectimicrobiota bacterium TaxID=2528274 RepID=A0A932I2F1_UNCTE|nr:hypothetical protein [Candidatus Tectomicrobia bacterium]
MVPSPGGRTAEITRPNSKVYEEGMAGGLIGAATIALWFFLLDLYQGRPLFTPSVLGTALFRGGVDAASAQSVPVSFEMVITFTWVHTLVFVAIGVAAAWLIRLAERDPNYGFGIFLLFVFFEFGFIAVSSIFAEGVVHALTVPAILAGNFLAAAAMGAFFWRRHPGMLRFYP